MAVQQRGDSPRSTQRGKAATKSRNISRKACPEQCRRDAKGAKKKYLSELGVLCALAGGISESDMVHVSKNLRKPRKLLKQSQTRFFLDYAGEKGSPVGEQPTNSTDDHGSASVMPAWTNGIQVGRDASGNIDVNLDSGTPCRNGDTEESSRNLSH